MHDQAPTALQQEWAKVDVILMVCNAAQAARQVDSQQLNAIRHYFQEQCTNQALPVILAVATHIDRLRPIRDWQPPYNIEDGLMPLIHEHLNAEQRVRYLRCLRQQQAQSYWRHWRKQALQAGQLIFKL